MDNFVFTQNTYIKSAQFRKIKLENQPQPFFGFDLFGNFLISAGHHEVVELRIFPALTVDLVDGINQRTGIYKPPFCYFNYFTHTKLTREAFESLHEAYRVPRPDQCTTCTILNLINCYSSWVPILEVMNKLGRNCTGFIYFTQQFYDVTAVLSCPSLGSILCLAYVVFTAYQTMDIIYTACRFAPSGKIVFPINFLKLITVSLSHRKVLGYNSFHQF